jgi:hypothetical protein
MSDSIIFKRVFEALSQAFSPEALETLVLFLKPASYNRIEQGYTTISPLYQRQTCEPQKFLDVNGVAQTGNGGTIRFRLKDYICFENLLFDTPINVVATPLAARPVFLTVKHSLVMDPVTDRGIDVEIEVFAWDANGAAASEVTLNWRCRVPYENTVI